MSTNILKIIACAGLPLLTWGGGDHYVTLESNLELQPDAPVVWMIGNAREYAGTVSKVIANDNGGSTVWFNFRKDFQNIIREDARACAWLDKQVRESPFLLLVGGTNSTLSLIKRGGEILEQQFSFEKLPTGHVEENRWWQFVKWIFTNKLGMTVLLVVLVFVVLAFLFLKTVYKLLKYLLIVGGIVIIFYLGGRLVSDWKNDEISFPKYFKEIKDITSRPKSLAPL